MNTKVLLATLAAGIAAFLFGWLLFGILLFDFYAANTNVYEGLIKNPPDLIMIFISNLLTAFLLAYIFNRWANIRSAVEGARAGFIIVGIVAASVDLFLYATMNLYDAWLMAVDIVANGAFGAFIGAVVGMVLGSGRKVVSV